MASQVALSLRKHFNLRATVMTQAGPTTVSLGLGYGPCDCTGDYEDPQCRNKYSYIRDWVDGKPVIHKECPRRFDDYELWSDIRVVLWELGDWDKTLNFFGVPVVHLSTRVYEFIGLCFAARDRYHQQRDSRELK